jgi:chorismate dehydratase
LDVPGVGIVGYLNAVPLVEHLPPSLEARRGDPSEVAAWLAAGEIDAGLLPVAEALRGEGGSFLGRFGIACDGDVESVLAFLPRADEPPAAWPRRVVLDPASRTSQALLRLLLERVHGCRPHYEEALEPGPDPARYGEAIVLVIGDRALARRRTWTGGVLDLGAAWKAWTGLPFVFARWTARRGLPAAERARLAGLLDEAAQRGLAELDRLAATHGPRFGLSVEEAVRYLGRSVRYELDARAEAGLRRFAEELAAGDRRTPCST